MAYLLLGPCYRLCERLVFGRTLDRARESFHKHLPPNVLIVGEGDGRHASKLTAGHQLWVLEKDATMRGLIAARCPNVRLLASLPEVLPVEAVLFPFVLDCLSDHDLTALLQEIETSCPQACTCIVTDFFPGATEGPRGWQALTKGLTWIMYRFFELAAGLTQPDLPNIEQALRRQGFELAEERTFWRGYIRSQLWKRR